MIRIFTLLAFTVLTMGQSFAQDYVNYERDSRWFIGLNVGGTWTTQTEIPYRLRAGYGFTFGKSIGMNRDDVFSWDIRARFLHAQFQGQATERYALDSTSTIGLGHYGNSLQTYQDSLGYFIPNYRTNLLSGSLELVLNTNRWRQNTGWNLSIFGGIGIKGYHTATDLVDNDIFLNEPIYDYENLGTSPSQTQVLNIQDGDYETDLVGDAFDYEVDWAPSFGFGISKQVHPFVAIGLEHKMTWTRNNLFDGMPNNFDGTSAVNNDMYHYTSLGIKFHLPNGRRDVEPDPDPITEDPDIDDFDTDPVIDPVIDEPVSRKKPIVDIYDPNSSPHTTTENTFRIKANIYYVDGKSDVTFKQDGNINTNFSFNPSNNQFASNVVLHPGQNLFEITGVNESGSDYESVIIIYKEEEAPRNPPIVTITNPPYTPYYTSSNIFGLVSTVLNVDSKSQIRVYLNGVNLHAFSYDNGSKVVNASLNLIEGTNTVTVTGTNEVGSDSKTVEIIYRKPQSQQPPIVDFVNPGVDPYYTSVSTISIRATALHVARKSDLTVKVNGNIISGFSFNAGTKEIFFNTNLLIGANIVEITGVNEAGMDQESTTIIYTRPETPQPPIVTFIDPDTDPITVYTSNYNVEAKVEHVASAADITLKINGVVTGLFTYSTSSDIMNFSTSLVEGSNVIEIKGTNAYGEDLETTTIIYKRSIPQAPPIVDITYTPVDNMEFESPNITVVATVLNVASSSDINVLLNGAPVGGFTYNTYTKVLNLPVVLEEGSNIVQVTGANMAGTDTDTRIIKYKKPVVPCPPTVYFVNPATTPHLTDDLMFTVTANTTHIDAKSQIVFKQNGALIPDAAYDFVAGHQIIYNATLIPGSNIFEVTVENADGSASDLTVINFEQSDEPCLIPTVGYISPVPYSTVDEPGVTIDAQINNHSPGTTVELKLNGVSQGYMTYNGETSIASKAVTLLEGSNAVKVIVTNECGTNQATFTLNYEAPDAPCFDPTLSSATATGVETTFTVISESVDLYIASTHVADASEISVKLNGADIPFSFDVGTGVISIEDINLIVGVNTLSITATTDCGTAVRTYTITRLGCESPVISGVTPTSGTSTDATSIIVNATVSNATAADILLLLNGVSHEFGYNEDTDLLSEALPLEIGENSIQIRVETDCGVDKKVMTIIREIPCEAIVTNLLTPASNLFTAPEDVFNIVLNATGIENVGQITATLNGAAVAPSFDGVSGDIALPGLNLEKGENTVVVALANECSESTVTYTITYNGCEAPVIVFNGIVPGMTVTESIYNLSVVITNVADASDITLLVNGLPVDFDYDAVTHLLKATFPLNEGVNRIDVEADGCEKADAMANIEYKEPCQKIGHTFLSPNTPIATSVESVYTITLSTVGIETASQVNVKLNGAALIPFMFNPETGIITISGINLIDGANTIRINMKNECSSEVVNYTINYNGCDAPKITMGANPAAVTAQRYNFEANISNVASPGAIQLTLNGGPVPFVFNPETGGLEASFNLTEGDNTIGIVANGCEKASAEFKVNYSIPCTPIAYTLGSPSSLTTEVADDTYNINLVVQHATSAGINVTNGGLPIPFSYVDNILSISGINLVDGTNTVTVRVVNDCSTENIVYTIEHDDCNTPEINMAGNNLTSETATYNFVTTVTNIADAAKIQLMVNGFAKPFEFDAGTGLISATLTLNEGANTVSVSAVGCVSVSDMIRITYAVPCDPVTYGLVSPNALVTESVDETISVRLNTTDVNPATVSVTLNGNPIPSTISGGVISVNDISLADGANTIEVAFGNDCSFERVTFTVDHNPCSAPVISFAGLTDGATVTEQDLVLLATIFNVADAGEITLRFNGVATTFDFDEGTRVLEAPLTLVEGSNEIEIIIDGCERVTEIINVIYDVPCAPPTYTMVSPTETSHTVTGDTYTVTLTVGNVTADQVDVKLNGATIDFTYSSGTVIFEVPYISVPTNSVVVTLENDCGTETVNYLITYVLEDEDCTPTVSATFSGDKLSTTASSDKALINVILNLDDGTTQLITDVTGMSGTFSATGEKEGRCIVGVWIRSGCNISAAGEPFGDYVANPGWDGLCEDPRPEDPCSPITYRLITPSRLSTTTTVSPYTIVMEVNEVAEARDITALVNGVTRPLSFDGSRITLSGITLNSGSNTIQFSLRNDCSSELVTYTISYSPPGFAPGNKNGGNNDLKNGNIDNGGNGGTKAQIKPQPEIIPVSPSQLKSTVKTQTFSLRTKVTNVSGKSDIEMWINGVRYTAFNYSTGTSQLSTVIRLNAGVNAIRIRANNGKAVEKTYYVTYQVGVAQKDLGGGGGNGGLQQGASLTPKLERIAPKSSSFTTDRSTYNLKVRALNVTSKSGLTLTVNGVRTTNFSFSSSTKIMSAVLRLKTGNNTVRIDAVNGSKKASLTYTINYKKAAQNLGSGQAQNNGNNGGFAQTAKKPQFKMISPSSTKATVKSSTFVLKTKILNVKSKSGITLTVNGVRITGFTFNGNTGDLVATLKLKSGSNSIRISAKNGNQVATLSYTITYQKSLPSSGRDLGAPGTSGSGQTQGSGEIRRR